MVSVVSIRPATSSQISWSEIGYNRLLSKSPWRLVN